MSALKLVQTPGNTGTIQNILPGASTSSVKDILPDSTPMPMSSWFHSLSDHDEELHDEESPPKDITKVQSTSNAEQKIVGVCKEDMAGLITSIEVADHFGITKCRWEKDPKILKIIYRIKYLLNLMVYKFLKSYAIINYS
ncbi:uncharacterized protein LOC111026500 isoform X1 [Myzus persicae]|uniref:uncharacterized protein LOC111026500 isoform X1 n=1 Tax=Myzus persicae TaxID=13164 RepID=UPI000B9379C4|nr:uncharacterized protein LOC111026500 isoform X1 [Myzus persicae]